jgi:6-phosphogluconolactonase
VDPAGKFLYMCINSGTLSTTLVPLAGTSSIEDLAVTPSNSFVVGTDVCSNRVIVWSIDQNTGALTQASEFGDPQTTTMIAPRGVAIDPSGKFVLVANSQSSDVSVLSLSSSGTLTPVAGSPFAAGSGPTSIAISASGKVAFVGNVGSNNMSVFPIRLQHGSAYTYARLPRSNRNVCI